MTPLRRRPFLAALAGAATLPLLPRLTLAQDTAAQDAAAPAVPVIRDHAIAMHGDLKYATGFSHFDYVNPSAPKGGRLVQSDIGPFDSFNGFIAKGDAAPGIGLVTETLMTGSLDEPFSEYGLLAETIEYPADRSGVLFHLNPAARWHDGRPVTVEDVIWTFESLLEKGAPYLRFYYAGVAEVAAEGAHAVRFVFHPGENRELPLILGQLAVLPKHWWTSQGREIGDTTLEPPLGSGPYRVKRFEAGRFVEYERVTDWWGRDLPVNRGRHNFDLMRYEVFRNALVQREALKAGTIDTMVETQAKAWATEYDIPQVRDGRLLKEQFENRGSGGMQNFTFNTRREVFKDRRVRWALAHAFDFEWTNRNLFNGLYVRPNSYFYPTELASSGLPRGAELALLEPYRGRVPDEVFTQVYTPPATDGSGWPRENLRKAFAILAEAGWVVRDMKLVNAESGRQMAFEILLRNPQFERLALPFVRNLTRLGIAARVRTVDSSQYINRLRSFDFDMIVGGIGQSLSPGNEQRSYWSTAAADEPGGYNYPGVKDPVVDELVELVIAAPDRESLVQRTRALDRVLLWGHYGIPQWTSPFTRLLSWNKFGRPPEVPLQGISLDTWWYDANKAAILEQRGGQETPEAAPEAGAD
jgi:microcin C transport system substrate-binding protein